MKSNHTEKEAKEHVEDFLDGLYDTVIGVPVAFGDFLGRVSGFRDWQNEGIVDLKNAEQKQALLETKILYEALTHEKSAIAIKEALTEDFQERPAYYLGGMGIQQALTTTLSTIGKIGYGTAMTSTKMENAIHEKYDMVKEFTQLEDEKFNILTEDVLSTVNWFDDFEENINLYMKKQQEEKSNDTADDIEKEFMEMHSFSNEQVEQLAKENERPITTYLEEIQERTADVNESGRTLYDDYGHDGID